MFFDFVFSWYGLIAFSPVILGLFLGLYRARRNLKSLFWMVWHFNLCKGKTKDEIVSAHSGELWGEYRHRYTCTKCQYEAYSKTKASRDLNKEELDSAIDSFGKKLAKMEREFEEREKKREEERKSRNRFNTLEI